MHVRPHPNPAKQYGDFNLTGTAYRTTNAQPFEAGVWHNITIVQEIYTNTEPPVIDATQFTPANGQVTVNWTSSLLDSSESRSNAPSQVDTNQQYLVQEATELTGPWTTIATVGPNGVGTQSYTYADATNDMAFYRVVKPRIRLAQQRIYADGTNVDFTLPGKPHPTSPNYKTNGAWQITTTSFGAFYRQGNGSPGGFTTELIDDAAVWNRALTTNEIAFFIKDGITNIGELQPPLSANLNAQFPSVAQNDSLALNWSASKLPATLALAPGVGDVTPISNLGLGSTNVIVTSNTTYRLIATRSGNSVTSSVPINCVSNVTAGWHYLDSFTYLPDGPVAGQGGWQNPANSVVTVNISPLAVHTATSDGNKLAAWDSNPQGGVAGHALNACSVGLEHSNTIFFRFYIDPAINADDPNFNEPSSVDINLGVTDKGIRDVVDIQNNNNVGLRIFRNNAGQGPGVALPIDLQAVNGPATMALIPSSYSYVADTVNGDANGLATGKVYSVWIDVQNVLTGVDGGTVGSGSGTQTNGDLFTIYLQREDWPARTNLFSGINTTNSLGDLLATGVFVSARDEVAADIDFPQQETLRTLFMAVRNSTTEQGTNQVRFDDFFISTNSVTGANGIRTDVPVTAKSFVTP